MDNLNKYSEYAKNTGDFLKDNFNSELAQNMGTKIHNAGSLVQDTINAPKNYFQGVVKNNLGNVASKAGDYLAQKTGMAQMAGNALSNFGSSLAGSQAAGSVAGGAASGAATGSTAGAMAAGPLIGLAVMALKGDSRNAAQQDMKNNLAKTNELVNAEAANAEADLQNTAQIAEQIQKQSDNQLQKGVVTGGAANIQDSALNDYVNNLASYISSYKGGQQALDKYGLETIQNGVYQGLNYGIPEISDWINQYNDGMGRNNPVNIPQTQEEIELARNNQFNENPNIQKGGVVEDNNNTKGIWNKVVNGLTDFNKGYQENKNTAYNPENLRNVSNKSLMNRLGEGVGTVSRIAEKPAVQALIAGGLSTALTGNPLYGLGMANEFAKQRQRTNAFQEVLRNNGINIDVGALGTLNNNDFNTFMEPKYKENANNIDLAKLEETQNYHDLMMKYYNDKLEELKNYHGGMLKNGAINANANVIKAQKTGQNVNSLNNKEKTNTEYNSNLAKYNLIINNPNLSNEAKSHAKQGMINQYGSKFLTDEKKLQGTKNILSEFE